MSVFCFIFARGGSKGLPRKNIKSLVGKPLICYSIESAQAVPSIEHIFVSTEDEEIANIARKAGAIIIDRPIELAQDNTPEWLAWQHAIQWAEKHYGEFDEFVSLPTTSPLRSKSDIENAIEKRRQVKADVCISVTPASRSPYFNMVKINDSDCVELVISEEDANVHRRQDAPKVFDITTVVYVSTPEFVNNNTGLFDGLITSIEVPKKRAVDIDDIYDFMLAEVIIKSKV